MGMFDQLKMAQDMLKGMSADDVKKLMEQAKESKSMLEDTVRTLVAEEIKKQNLVRRDEVEALLRNHVR